MTTSTFTFVPAGGRYDLRGSGEVERNLGTDGSPDLLHPTAVVRFQQTAVGGDTARSYVMTTPWRCRVLDAWHVAKGTAATTSSKIQVFNGTSAISDSMSHSATDGGVTRAAVIDPDYSVVAKGGSLKVTWTVNSSETNIGECYVVIQVLP